MTTNEIEVRSDPNEMIRYAIEKNAPIEQLERLLALRERYEAAEARKAYHVAMAGFKAEPPKIRKDKKVKFSGGSGAQVGYSHASLGNVTETINTGLSKHGLSAAWFPAQNGGSISVTTRITHKLGHFEECTLTAQADTSGAKNSIQAIGSTISYLERYGLLALAGLATYDMDDDGAAAVTAFIDKKQLNNIIDLLSEKNANQAKFLEYMGVESLEKIPASQYTRAVAAINSKPAAKAVAK